MMGFIVDIFSNGETEKFIPIILASIFLIILLFVTECIDGYVMSSYIKRMDFIIGIQATAPFNCAMLSYNDTIYINFIRNVRLPELERHFYAVMQELGLHPTVESNNTCEV